MPPDPPEFSDFHVAPDDLWTHEDLSQLKELLVKMAATPPGDDELLAKIAECALCHFILRSA